MTPVRASLYRYSLPLAAPLAVGGGQIEAREGLLLCVETQDGAMGWGEAAPLPGFSRASVDEAESALDRVADWLLGRPVASPLENSVPEGHPAGMPPSVQFASEGALLSLAADHQGTPVVQRLGGRDRVELNGLIPANTADLPAAAERYRQRGFQTVKLKVGREEIRDDVQRVHRLAEGMGTAGTIRLDANRAWTVEEAVSFAEALGPVPLEYIEEPLASPKRLSAFTARTGMPIALDETTREWTPDRLSEIGSVAAVVLKPTLLGGLTTVQRWARAARSADAVPVVSASYESGVGIRLLTALAANLSTAAAGLSTYEQLAADVLVPRLSMEGPIVEGGALDKSTVDRSRLTNIAVHE